MTLLLEKVHTQGVAKQLIVELDEPLAKELERVAPLVPAAAPCSSGQRSGAPWTSSPRRAWPRRTRLNLTPSPPTSIRAFGSPRRPRQRRGVGAGEAVRDLVGKPSIASRQARRASGWGSQDEYTPSSTSGTSYAVCRSTPSTSSRS